MEKKYLFKKLFAGAFFVSCIVLIVSVIFIIGVERGLTEPKFKMKTLFRKVGGLTIGAPVRLSGVTVGTVSGIDFLEREVRGRGVKVELSVFTKYKSQVYKTTRIAIITEGVLGEKMVEISTDPDIKVPSLEKSFIGEDPLDVQDLAETFGEAAVALLQTSKTIETMTSELKMISSNVRRVLNRLEQRIIEGTLFKVF